MVLESSIGWVSLGLHIGIKNFGVANNINLTLKESSKVIFKRLGKVAKNCLQTGKNDSEVNLCPYKNTEKQNCKLKSSKSP